MKLFNVISVGLAVAALSACENADREFPDYDGGTSAYFANQYPVRTIVLGESETFNTDLDNEHRFEIYATMGGAYNGRNAVVDIAVDNSLVKDLYFDEAGTQPVKVLPADWYTLSANQINYGGNLMGAVGVQLDDKFFADKGSLSNTYVIPVKMGNCSGIDRVLVGKTDFIPTPSPHDVGRWEESPKDFVLYCVKFINEWDGKYINKFNDSCVLADGSKADSVATSMFGDQDYGKPVLELCPVIDVKSLSLTEVEVSRTIAVKHNGVVETAPIKLKLTKSGDAWTLASATEGVTASGTAKFVKKSDEVWGNKNRDAFYLDYTLTFADGAKIKSCTSKDVLVAQTRNVGFETFTPFYIQK